MKATELVTTEGNLVKEINIPVLRNMFRDKYPYVNLHQVADDTIKRFLEKYRKSYVWINVTDENNHYERVDIHSLLDNLRFWVVADGLCDVTY